MVNIYQIQTFVIVRSDLVLRKGVYCYLVVWKKIKTKKVITLMAPYCYYFSNLLQF